MIIAKSEKIEAARGALGWSRTELAKQSGLSRARVSVIENGRESTAAQTAKKICDALDKSFDELFMIVPKGKEREA